jgi:dolichyl-phosphate beta-glucosyltransferase
LKEAYAYFTTSATASSSASTTTKQRSVVVDVASVEWILVNDGSKDDTTPVYRDFALSTMLTDLVQKKNANNNSRSIIMTWKVITFDMNRGKGAAVRAGMLSATGDAILMVDADGATEFGTGLEAVLAAAYSGETAGADVVFGSRSSHQNQHQQVERSTLRRLLQWVFHICVVVCVGGRTTTIRDTQCGFKLFRRDAAMRIFPSLHLRRWAFDTELLYLAVRLRYNIMEVPVIWHEVDGSKLHTGGRFGMFHLAVVSIGMLRDMVCVRLCYTLGWWTINREQQQQQQRGLRPKLA